MIRWDNETEGRNAERELQIARTLIEAAVTTVDIDVMRRLNQAALMHLDLLVQAPEAREEATA